MPRTKRIGGGESVEYTAAKFTKYSRTMCGLFKEWFPHEPYLLEQYKQYVEVYERIGQDDRGYCWGATDDEDLAKMAYWEAIIRTFLTAPAPKHCGLDKDNEDHAWIIKELTPSALSLILMANHCATDSCENLEDYERREVERLTALGKEIMIP